MFYYSHERTADEAVVITTKHDTDCEEDEESDEYKELEKRWQEAMYPGAKQTPKVLTTAHRPRKKITVSTGLAPSLRKIGSIFSDLSFTCKNYYTQF